MTPLPPPNGGVIGLCNYSLTIMSYDCFLLSSLGFELKFVPDNSDDTVCVSANFKDETYVTANGKFKLSEDDRGWLPRDRAREIYRPFQSLGWGKRHFSN